MVSLNVLYVLEKKQLEQSVTTFLKLWDVKIIETEVEAFCKTQATPK